MRTSAIVDNGERSSRLRLRFETAFLSVLIGITAGDRERAREAGTNHLIAGFGCWPERTNPALSATARCYRE